MSSRICQKCGREFFTDEDTNICTSCWYDNTYGRTLVNNYKYLKGNKTNG